MCVYPCDFLFVSPSIQSGPGASVIPGAHLSLGESQLGRQVGALGQGQVLGLLEALVQGLQLQAGVDGSGLPYFFPFAIQTQVPVLDHR